MTEAEFFERLQEHHTDTYPFVAYRKPNEKTVKAFLQRDTQIHFSRDLTESGFLFAPFDDRENAVLIPEGTSEKLFVELNDLPTGSDVSEREDTTEANLAAKERHRALVKKGLEKLNSGELEKVVLSRKEPVDLNDQKVLSIFQDLLEAYPAAFVYIFFHPGVGLWLGATPETLLRVEGRRFHTMALAGTQKFEGNTGVKWSEKEKQEQQFVTDEIVSRIEPFVTDIRQSAVHTVQAGKLLHLKTDIEGQITPSEGRKVEGKSRTKESRGNLKELIYALHPTPAVCGLPREKAKDFITSQEGYDREFYTGFLGELNLQKNLQRSKTRRNVENLAYRTVKKETDLYVNLRCMRILAGKAHLYVGGGITKDSEPEAEWEETVNKAGTMKKVLLK